jgi:hypothetical protein
MGNPEDDWMTVDQAAHHIANSPGRVGVEIAEGLVPSAMLGSVRVVPRLWADIAKATGAKYGRTTRIDWAASLAEFNERDAA